MCKSRKTPALCLAILSTIVFVLGILIIIMTVGLDAVDSALSTGTAAMPEMKAATTTGALILYLCAALSLIVACAGCAAVKIKHRAYIMLYGCCLGSIWLAVFIVGCILAGTAAATPAMMNAVCDQGVPNPSNAYQGNAFDKSIQLMLNGRMCTPTCPCPGSAKATYDALPASKMNFWSRTAQVGSGNSTSNLIQMYYAGSNTFNTFQECFPVQIAP